MYERIASEVALDDGTSVLDVGLTPDTSLADSNFFEQHHRSPHQIVGVSPEPIAGLRPLFPEVTLVQASGTRLPIRAGAFDVCVSFAVIEHVGDRTRQHELMHEMLRVSDVAVITTPNRWFPIELHTFLPFVHWLPRPAHRWVLRRIGLGFWSEESNLHLLSRSELEALIPPGYVSTFLPFRLFGLTSNLVAVVRADRGGLRPAS